VSGIAPLFSEEQISARVETVAREIANAPLKPDIALPILAGSFVFAADLLRALAKKRVSLPVEFIWLRRYGAERHGSEVAVLIGPPEELHGRTALLIDGVLDHGHTLMKARDLLLENGAATVIIAVAVDKNRHNALIKSDYALFSGVTDFIVGYGMDDAGRGRGLPNIESVQ
jgi:hypoxanthine phosphoribosyltransferase